jgi:hypothetical protein
MTQVDALYYGENAYSKAMEQRAKANVAIKDDTWYSFGQYSGFLGNLVRMGGLALGN